MLMSNCSTDSKTDASKTTDALFLAHQVQKFQKILQQMDDAARHSIQHNRQLNHLYDAFLDFILDASQHLKQNT